MRKIVLNFRSFLSSKKCFININKQKKIKQTPMKNVQYIVQKESIYFEKDYRVWP